MYIREYTATEGEKMTPNVISSIPELASAFVVGLLALTFGIQKLFKQWGSVSAENSVVSLMHGELERLSKQNTVLATELSKLQIEILSLNKELRTLSYENQSLHTEVATLTAEVSRLQTLLKKHSANLGETEDGSTS